jgi:hypothetical protein
MLRSVRTADRCLRHTSVPGRLRAAIDPSEEIAQVQQAVTDLGLRAS